jgi:hypothetical protein
VKAVEQKVEDKKRENASKQDIDKSQELKIELLQVTMTRFAIATKKFSRLSQELWQVCLSAISAPLLCLPVCLFVCLC